MTSDILSAIIITAALMCALIISGIADASTDAQALHASHP